MKLVTFLLCLTVTLSLRFTFERFPFAHIRRNLAKKKTIDSIDDINDPMTSTFDNGDNAMTNQEDNIQKDGNAFESSDEIVEVDQVPVLVDAELKSAEGLITSIIKSKGLYPLSISWFRERVEIVVSTDEFEPVSPDADAIGDVHSSLFNEFDSRESEYQLVSRYEV